MKCPKCNHDQRRKAGLECHNCGYRFHFDPKAGGLQMTDGRFLAIVRHATAKGTRYVTEDELYAVACRRRGILRPEAGGIMLLAIGVFVFIAAAVNSVLLGAIAGLTMVFVGGLKLSRPLQLSRAVWDGALEGWQASGRRIENLITTTSLHTPPPEWSEPDIYDYGFERLLICDERLTVDWLVKNGVHTDSRALIVSEDGYPSYLIPLAQRALKTQPELKVFLLHAYQPSSAPMTDRVRAQAWWPKDASHPFIDLGLSESDVRQLRLPTEVTQSIPSVPVHAVPLGILGGTMALALADGVMLADAFQRRPVESYG